MNLTHLLDSTSAKAFAGLTFPRYRHLVGSDKAPLVAVGAGVLGQPVGLALGWYSAGSETKKASVFSVNVHPAYRRQGLGSALLAHLEAELAERGANHVTGEFAADRSGTTATQHLLVASGWSSPTLDRLVCMTDLDTIVKAPWMNDYALPDGFEIFPWLDLSEDEAARIAEWDHTQGLEGEWDEAGLSTVLRAKTPFEYNSMGLRKDGEVVGWMLTDRVAPDTLRYDRLYVRHDLRAAGLGVILLAASIWANYECESHHSPSRRGVWQTMAVNRPMVAFIKRRMAPYLTGLTEVYAVGKPLSDSAFPMISTSISETTHA